MARREIGEQSKSGGGGDPRILDLRGPDPTRVRILEPYIEEWRQYTLREGNREDASNVRFVVARPGDMLSKKGFRSSRRFAVNVWDYGSNSVKILMGGPGIFDEFDTWKKAGIDPMGSDAVVTRSGQGLGTSYKVARLDSSEFQFADQATELHDLSSFDTPPSEEQILNILSTLGIDYDAIRLPTFTLQEALEKEMPFGKYKGMTVEDLLHTQPDYLDWFVGNCESSGRVGDDMYIIIKTALTNGEFDPNANNRTVTQTATERPAAAESVAEHPAGPGYTDDPSADAGEPQEGDEPERQSWGPTVMPAGAGVQVDVPEEFVKSQKAFSDWARSQGLEVIECDKTDAGIWLVELSDETSAKAGSRKEAFQMLVRAHMVPSETQPAKEPEAAPAAPAPAPAAPVAAPAAQVSPDALKAECQAILNKPEWQNDFRRAMEVFDELGHGYRLDDFTEEQLRQLRFVLEREEQAAKK